MFVDKEGNEIDRIVGFKPPQEYLAEMTRIRNGVNTYPDLLRQWDEDPLNAEVLASLAMKVEGMGGLEAAVGYWEELFKLDNVDSKMRATANYKMASYMAQQQNDPSPLLSLLNTEKDVDILLETHGALVSYYKRAKDAAAEATAYKRYVDFTVGAGQESPGFLNGYAWRMTQLEQNLEDALDRINEAVTLLDSLAEAREQAQILDTKAEVLWKLGRIEDAVNVIDSCIVLQPEDSYYQEQRTKFTANI